jgi:predicted PhzF superfamily epimerase YddE/YHI9
MKSMHVVYVFVNEDGLFGNPVGVIVDEDQSIAATERLRMVKESGFSEVVFIDNISESRISIYSPQGEVPFAGHAVVGVAYFFKHELHMDVHELIGKKGVIEVWEDNGKTWAKGAIATFPPWNYEQLDEPLLVEQISDEEASVKKHTFVWAWKDEQKGMIRARTFASDWGIPEDEANGSGSMKLATQLGRKLVIYHGKGSLIFAEPSGEEFAIVGGMVKIK